MTIVTQNLPILIDQDGVLADFVKTVYDELMTFLTPTEHSMLPSIETLKTFYIEESIDTGNYELDMMLKKILREVVDHRPGLFRKLDPLPGAIHYVKMLKEAAAAEDLSVIICTAPHIENKTCHSDKAQWVEEHLGYDWAKSMVVTHDKTLVHGLLLIDDKPIVNGSITPIWQHVIFDAPYNKASHGPRVSGWNEQTVNEIIRLAQRTQLINGLR